MRLMQKKFLCILVVIPMLLLFIPVTGVASDTSDLFSSQAATVPTVYYYDPVSGETLSTTDYTEINSMMVDWGSDDEEITLVANETNITVENRICVIGDVKLILLDGAYLSAQMSITVVRGCSLSIYAGSTSADSIEGTGILSALDYSYRGDYGAAIGGFVRGGMDWEAGTLNIYGGNVNAIARYEYNCAIGGAYISIGRVTGGGILNVYGGTVKGMVIGNGKGAGIGGNGGEFNFYGGVVYANGGAEGEEGTYYYMPADAIGSPVGLSNHGALSLGSELTLYKSEDKGTTYTPYSGTVERYRYMKVDGLCVTVLGDANCSGDITAADAALILLAIVGNNIISAQGKLNADVNDDHTITIEDAALILRYVVKLILEFPTPTQG